jgi:8-amino-7-oxononanoate synthase
MKYNQSDFYGLIDQDLFKKCDVFKEGYDLVNESNQLDQAFSVIHTSGLDREVKVLNEKGQEVTLTSFDSNGYLGLQHHPEVIGAASEAFEHFGAGTPSVSLLGGMSDPLKSLEQTIAKFHQREDALIFSSAYMANVGVMIGLLREGDTVVMDVRAHASLHDGARICRTGDKVRFDSNKLEDLEGKLAKIRTEKPNSGILIATDSVFSMSGRLVDLKRLREIATKYGAKLLVDECHSVGVLGATGRGIEEHVGLMGASDILVGCFSKAFGSFGGYVVGSKELIHYLRFFAHPWIFSTSYPAHSASALLKVFEVFEREPEHLQRLTHNTRYFKKRLKEIGLGDYQGPSPIVPIPIGDNEKLFNVAGKLFAAGVKAGIVSYPAVPKNKSILRIVITARHNEEDMEKALGVLQGLTSQ